MTFIGFAVLLEFSMAIFLDGGIGAGIDSYLEYLLKSYVALGEPIYLEMFNIVC